MYYFVKDNKSFRSIDLSNLNGKQLKEYELIFTIDETGKIHILSSSSKLLYLATREEVDSFFTWATLTATERLK